MKTTNLPPALPRAAEPFIEFSGLLRTNGFSIAPEQTENFITAVGLLGPHSIHQIHMASIATLAPPPERRAEFDALFQMVFLGQTIAASVPGVPDEDDLEAFDQGEDGDPETLETEETIESGAEAVSTELLASRSFQPQDDTFALSNLQRRLRERLPHRKSRRHKATKTGPKPDLRKALREAVRRDGEILQLPGRKRSKIPRRVVIIVDVSGSMKAEVEGYLQVCHAVMMSTSQCEVFTLGTRLTRITRALNQKNRVQALANASAIVADWDGGTRLGDAMQAFLDVPRFAGFARGALVVVLSDGLERGEPDVLTRAMEKLSQLAWSVLWLTPLATNSEYQPQTDAMRAIGPYVDRFGNGASLVAICEELLGYARRAA